MEGRLLVAILLALAALAAAPGASAIPPVCIERNLTVGPADAHVGQCGPQSVDVDLCAGEGTVTGPDGGSYRATLETCLPDPCDGLETGLVLGLVGVGLGPGLGPGCHVTLSLDLVDCTWQEAWGSETYGPITVRQTHCVDGT